MFYRSLTDVVCFLYIVIALKGLIFRRSGIALSIHCLSCNERLNGPVLWNDLSCHTRNDTIKIPSRWKRWAYSGGSRNFKTGGRGPGVEFLGSEVCFDAPFIHTLYFVVRVENRIHIVNIVKVYACYKVKIYKYKPPNNFKQARRGWIRLWHKP